VPKKKKKRVSRKKTRKLKKSRKKTRKLKKSRKKIRKLKKSRKKIRKLKRSKKKFKRRKISIKKQISKPLNHSKDADGNTIIKVSESWANQAYVNESKYKKKYKLSIKENEKFWAKEGKRISWIKKYTKIKDIKYSKEEVKIKWYYDGTLNASISCIDRHLKKNSKKTAIIWVGDDPADSKKISYKELHQNVCKAANGLKNIGVQKGDKVTIYLTMIPELAYVMLACARIGAVHSIIFGGFSPDSIATRINDCESNFLITADEGVRGGKIIPLKKIADEALTQCPEVKKCVVIQRTGNQVDWDNERDR
jgi:acetyl-CoA synthetase